MTRHFFLSLALLYYALFVSRSEVPHCYPKAAVYIAVAFSAGHYIDYRHTHVCVYGCITIIPLYSGWIQPSFHSDAFTTQQYFFVNSTIYAF